MVSIKRGPQAEDTSTMQNTADGSSESPDLVFPWGVESYPFSKRARGYLQWFQALPVEDQFRYLQRLLGARRHRFKLTYPHAGRP